MPITDPAAIDYSNGYLRVCADVLRGLVLTAEDVLAEYDDDPALAQAYADGSAETIADGSDLDGRTPVTGADATALIGMLREFVASYRSPLNTRTESAERYAVNGRSRFYVQAPEE